MSDTEALGLAVAGVAVLGGAALGRWAPSFALPAILVLVPLRVGLVPWAEPATLVLCGVACARARSIVETLREEPAVFAATLALPLWVAASVVWARQSAFVPALLGKWAIVTLAAWVAAADRTRDPRPLVIATLVAIVPSALWGAAERLHWVAPAGEARELYHRAIAHGGSVRGRALFWHPNRLGEFVEQGGLLLAGAGLGGVVPWFCLLGVVGAAVGVWGTGSMGSLAALGGGLCLVGGWWLAARGRLPGAGPRIRIVAALVLVAVVSVGAFAYWAHGGLGPRREIFSFAADRIREQPWLGHGAGNWSLLVGGASLEISTYWFRGHAHSLPLHVWVELGFVGVGLLFAFFFVPLGSAVRRFGSVSGTWRGVGVGAVAACAALFVHNFMHYFLRDAADGILTGLLLGTVVAVARRAAPGPP